MFVTNHVNFTVRQLYNQVQKLTAASLPGIYLGIGQSLQNCLLVKYVPGDIPYQGYTKPMSCRVFTVDHYGVAKPIYCVIRYHASQLRMFTRLAVAL